MSRPKKIPLMVKQAEAKKLSALIVARQKIDPSFTQARIAREFSINGGPAMVHHHMKAVSPISMDAGIAYCKCFGIQLSELSPRLANEANKRSDAIKGDQIANITPPHINSLEARILDVFRKLDDDRKQDLIDTAEMYLNKQKTSGNLLSTSTKKAANSKK